MQASVRGEGLFGEHPSADDLVLFSLNDPGLPTENLARIGAHILACPTCRLEVEITRKTHARTGWQSLVPGTIGGLPPAWRVLGPVAALLALLLAWPAYVGLKTVPELRRSKEAAEKEVREQEQAKFRLEEAMRAARSRIESMENGGGGVPLLVLASRKRGSPEATPVLNVRDGQFAQPVIIDLDLTARIAIDPDGPVEISLSGAGGEAWKTTAALNEVWDPVNGFVSFIAPARLLTPGAYRISIVSTKDGAELYSGRFRVAESGR